VKAALPSILLLLGLYLPTSLSGEYETSLLGAGLTICAGLCGVMLSKSRPAYYLFPLAALIPAIILLFTYTSGLHTLALGALLPFSVLALILLVRIKGVRLDELPKKLFLLANCINVFLGIGMILGLERVESFIGAYYAYIDSDFVAERMISLHKPVVTFYTHSIAAFMFYLFFYLNLRSFSANRKKIFGILSFSYLALLLALISTTSLILFFVGSFQFAIELWRTRHRVFLALTLASALSAPLFFSSDWETFKSSMLFLAERQDAGFVGRYNMNGEIGYNLKYLTEHPFSPIGASSRAEIRLGDSGPLDYVLRGSLPLFILIYGGYFLFLRSNLKYRKDLWLIFFATLGFELAASVLTYFRFLLLIPFICMYLNSLPESPPAYNSRGWLGRLYQSWRLGILRSVQDGFRERDSAGSPA
jgi:hypothetical protein